MKRWIFSLPVALVLTCAASARAVAPPDFSWVQQPVTSGAVAPWRVAVDRCGNIYTVGIMTYDTWFGTNFFSLGTNGYASSFFLAKQNRNGAWLWARSIPTTDPSTSLLWGCGVAVDSSNNVIVTGFAQSASDQTTNVLQGTNVLILSVNEIFVAKYSASGDFLWARGTGGTDGGYLHGVCVDEQNNIYVGGVFHDGNTTNDFLYLKLDPDGIELLRVKPDFGFFGTSSIRLDRGGNVYLCGEVDPPASIQGVPFVNDVNYEAFVGKFDSSGVFQWGREGGDGDDYAFDYTYATDLAIDSRTNVLVCGVLQATNLFGMLAISNFAGEFPFLAKLSSQGSNLWARAVLGTNGPFGSYAEAIAVDSAGNSYFSGTFGGSAQFDGTTLVSAGSGDSFLAMADCGGNFKWAKQAGTADIGNSDYIEKSTCLAIGSDAIVMGGLTGPFSVFDSFTTGSDLLEFENMYITAIDFPPPTVQIAVSGTNVSLTWPPMPSGFMLQSSTDLLGGLWDTNAPAPGVVCGNNQVTLGIAGGQKFFRLYRPMP